MEIIKEQTGEQGAMLTVKILREDYQNQVEQVLKDYRKKAKVPGFRPGMVPAGMIQKMYGKYVLVEEVSKLVSDSLTKYLSDEKVPTLGDPLPVTKETDWDNATEFEFSFEIGLAPEFSLELTSADKINGYEIIPDEKTIETYVQGYTRRFGSFVECDSISEGKEMIKGQIEELDEKGGALQGGISKDDSSIYLEFLKEESTKERFKGLKTGDHIDLNIKKAFPNDTELAAILGVKKEQVPSVSDDFRYTIKTISNFVNAPVDQSLFDKAFGEGKVTSEEEFMNKIREEIASNLENETEYKFRIDAKEMLLKKTSLPLPEDFLKRWLEHTHQGKFTMDQIEAEFGNFAQDLRWQMIVGKISKDNEVSVSEDEIMEFAKKAALRQFRQYGINEVPDEYLAGYAQNMLKKEEDARKMVEQLYEDKVLAVVREKVTIKNKKISQEDFDKLLA